MWRYLLAQVLFVFALIPLLVAGCDDGANDKKVIRVAVTSNGKVANEIPEIVVALGDSMQKVTARSSFKFDEPGDKYNWGHFSSSPSTFKYSDDGLSFELPEARYVLLATSLGHVVHIEVSPQLKYYTYDEAKAGMLGLIGIFDEAGWMRDEEMNSLLKRPVDLVNKIEKLPPTDGPATAAVMFWKNGDNKLQLKIKRIHAPGKRISQSLGVAETLYLLVIHIDNKRIIEKWTDESHQQRILEDKS